MRLLRRFRPRYLFLLLIPQSVHAHLASTGFGAYYDGAADVFLHPLRIASILALATFAGLRSQAAARYTLFCMTGGWVAGALIGIAPSEPALSILGALALLLPALLLAADAPVAPWGCAVVATVVGTINGVPDRSAGVEPLPMPAGILGAGAAVFVITALTAAAALSIHRSRWRVVLRVMGSWLAAMGILAAGWVIRFH